MYLPLRLTFISPLSIKAVYYSFSANQYKLRFEFRTPTLYKREEGKHE
jgi:hypothetical protein